MKIENYDWKDNNNVGIFFDEDRFVSFYIEDISLFIVNITQSQSKFYKLFKDNKEDKIDMIINKEQIRFIIFKQDT